MAKRKRGGNVGGERERRSTVGGRGKRGVLLGKGGVLLGEGREFVLLGRCGHHYIGSCPEL